MSKTAEMEISRRPETDSTHWPDTRLVRECLNGSQEAWSSLVHRYKNLIFSVPVKYGFNRDDAADVFQIVCVELLSHLPKIREPRALPKWLLMVTSHHCYHRKYKDEKNQLKVDEISRWFQEALPPEAEGIIQEVECEQALRNAISELAPQCRKLVQLLFFEEPARPYEQIAKELSLATGSIGLTRQRCLGRLRRRLKKSEVFGS